MDKSLVIMQIWTCTHFRTLLDTHFKARITSLLYCCMSSEIMCMEACRGYQNCIQISEVDAGREVINSKDTHLICWIRDEMLKIWGNWCKSPRESIYKVADNSLQIQRCLSQMLKLCYSYYSNCLVQESSLGRAVAIDSDSCAILSHTYRLTVCAETCVQVDHKYSTFYIHHTSFYSLDILANFFTLWIKPLPHIRIWQLMIKRHHRSSILCQTIDTFLCVFFLTVP